MRTGEAGPTMASQSFPPVVGPALGVLLLYSVRPGQSRVDQDWCRTSGMYQITELKPCASHVPLRRAGLSQTIALQFCPLN